MKLSNRLIAANFQKLIIYEYDRYGDMSHDTCLYFAIAHGANSLESKPSGILLIKRVK